MIKLAFTRDVIFNSSAQRQEHILIKTHILFGLAVTGLIIVGTAGSALAKSHHLGPQGFAAARPAAS